jgi:hypothetical protein
MALIKKGGAAVAQGPRAARKSSKVNITHPAKNETVTHPSYTLQIAVSEPAANVQVLIDEGDWQPCREALGAWWYDWSGYHASEHKVVARLCLADETIELSEPRIFEVRLD